MNKRKLVLFAHGKESGPWGSKIRALAEVAKYYDYQVESPDYSDLPDAKSRVERLLKLFPSNPGELILVGSSMGGYVSLAASGILKPKGLFLMAPAIGLQGYQPVTAPTAERTVIIHSWQDGIVPEALVTEYARYHQTELHLVNSDHRMTSALPFIRLLFQEFLDSFIPE